MKSPTAPEINHHHLPDDTGPASRKTRLMRTMSAMAAVLVMGIIVGSFLILLAHHSPGPAGLGPNSPSAAPLAVYVGLDAKDGTVYALRPSDGSILWQHRIDQGGQKFAHEPTIDHGVVYLTSLNGSIYALRASDGSLLWHRAVEGIPYQPVGADGTIIYLGASDGAIYALRTSDGSQLWHHPTSTPNALVLAVVNGQVYAFSGGLYALRASDGSVIWHDETLQFSSRSFVVTNGKVYVPENVAGHPSVVVLRASDGQHLQPLPVQGELAFADGILYISGQELYALRPRDDSVLWHTQSNCIVPTGRLSVNNGVVYTSVSVYQSSSGSAQQENAKGNVPEISTDVCALRTRDGKLLWHWHKSTVEGVTVPVVADGHVYFSTGVDIGNKEDGLYALRASDGFLLWHAFQGKLLDGPAVG